MQEADVPQVEALEQRLFPDPWPEGSFLYEVRNPFSHSWVAVVGSKEERVIGYLVLWVYEDVAEVATIAVAPEHQGQGVGTALLHKAIDMARRLGKKTLVLEVRVGNTRALTWYQRKGFRPVRHLPGYYRTGPGRWEDGLQMELSLETFPSASI